MQRISLIAESERIYLREITPEDAVIAFELNSDPQVIRFTGDSSFESVEEARSFLQSYSHYKDYGFGRWAVIRKSDETFLGWCGLKYDEEYKETDLGFRFFRKYWNQGYATEASQLCLKLAFDKFRMKRIVGYCKKENLASSRVMEKLGMKYCGRVVRDSDLWEQYELLS